MTFILPAHKGRFLREAVTSILAQTHADLRLVVVDDASPDDLQSIVAAFKDPRLAYVRNERNLGRRDLVEAWHRAMDHAEGEWCVLASDDDLYAPSYLEEMLRLAAQYPACDLFHSRAGRIDAQGQLIGVCEVRARFETQIEMAYSRAVLGLFQTMPDFMFRRSAWQAIGGFVRFPLAWFSDDATWIALAEHGVACSDQMLFFCRTSGVNVSASTDNLAEKIAAAEMFKAWLAAKVDTFVPASALDELMLRAIRTHAAGHIDEVTNRERARVPRLRFLRGLLP